MTAQSRRRTAADERAILAQVTRGRRTRRRPRRGATHRQSPPRARTIVECEDATHRVGEGERGGRLDGRRHPGTAGANRSCRWRRFDKCRFFRALLYPEVPPARSQRHLGPILGSDTRTQSVLRGPYGRVQTVSTVILVSSPGRKCGVATREDAERRRPTAQNQFLTRPRRSRDLPFFR